MLLVRLRKTLETFVFRKRIRKSSSNCPSLSVRTVNGSSALGWAKSINVTKFTFSLFDSTTLLPQHTWELHL